MIKKHLVLGLVILLFLFTRLYKISEIPGSLYWDEASIGYNAYSIIKTGRDEWGKFLPVHFRAFGEFKLPVYIYAVSLTELVLGNGMLAVRLPAVLFSLVSLIFVYLIAWELFEKKTIADISTLFFAASPWLFIFSRTGYEVTAGLAFYLAGIYFFILDRKWNLLISVVCFILSVYSYNSFIILTPLSTLVLVCFRKGHLGRVFKLRGLECIICLLLIFFALAPLVRFYKADGLERYNKVRTANLRDIPGNYLSHFSKIFLLAGDKNSRSQVPGSGQVYWIDLLLCILGIVYLLQKKDKSLFLIVLMLLGLIPAAITKESPHALRSLSVVPLFSILSAVGVDYLVRISKYKVVVYLTGGIVLVLFGDYFLNYINNYNFLSAKDWQYEYRQIFEKYESEFDKYDQVIISDGGAQPYIFALDYQDFDPTLYLKTVQYNSVDKWGFSKVNSFDRFVFEPIGDLAIPKGKSLIFALGKEKLQLTPMEVVKYPNQETALQVYVSER